MYSNLFAQTIEVNTLNYNLKLSQGLELYLFMYHTFHISWKLFECYNQIVWPIIASFTELICIILVRSWLRILPYHCSLWHNPITLHELINSLPVFRHNVYQRDSIVVVIPDNVYYELILYALKCLLWRSSRGIV